MNPIERAVKENRLKFYPNSSYSYIPSNEYKLKFGKKTITETPAMVIKNSLRRLDAIDRGFKFAERTGKKFSHIHNNTMVIV